MMWGTWGGGWWGLGMWLIGLVFMGLLAVGIVLAIRGTSNSAKDSGDGRRALDILDERFAHGEIDREEYEARKQVLLGAGRS